GSGPAAVSPPGRSRGGGGHAVGALGAEQGHADVDGLAMRHNHSTDLRALAPLPAKEQINRLLTDRARHGMTAREHEAFGAIGGTGGGGPRRGDHDRGRAVASTCWWV